jgi:sugar phosphate isomerase/epimerase
VKIGCHVSALQAVRAAPYDEGVRNAIELGFDAVELIAMSVEELNGYYTPEKCAELRELCASADLGVSQFAVYSPACQGLVSPDPDIRSGALSDVGHAIEIAAALGSPLFNLVAHWTNAFACPHPYPPSYIHPMSRGMTRWPSSKLVGSLPADWNHAEEWERYLGALASIADMARERGVRLAVEGHAHVLVSGTDAMLRMLDRLAGKGVVINLDTAWHIIQREFLPMSVMKLKGHIAHVHLRDSDGLINHMAPVGEGIIDWMGFCRALKAAGYSGVLSFEYAGFEDFLGVARKSKEYIESILGEA